MYYIHFPSGGFGHYMLQMMSICFEDVFCPKQEHSFKPDGTSHDYPVHYATWKTDPYTLSPLHDFGMKKGLVLIDSGIDNDVDKRLPQTVRMCIDRRARSIVYQTCREKAQNSEFVLEGADWEIREQFTKVYHHADANQDFYLCGWQPVENRININISDLFFNPLQVNQQLVPLFGKFDRGKFWTIWNDFIQANRKYYWAEHTATRMLTALRNNYNFDLLECSLHDQGYLNYCIEKHYGVEIPAYDYRTWFTNTQDIRNMIHEITNTQ